jgi:hypothetical protein
MYSDICMKNIDRIIKRWGRLASGVRTGQRRIYFNVFHKGGARELTYKKWVQDLHAKSSLRFPLLITGDFDLSFFELWHG